MGVELDRWGVIYCPRKKLIGRQSRWDDIRSYLEERNVHFDYVHSESYGSVERLSAMLVNNGYRIIVVIGGDSALNDAINGIMKCPSELRSNIRLAVIPNGVGNDFASFWGYDYDDFEMAVDAILCGRVRKVDVGVFQCKQPDGTKIKRFFLDSVNFGLGADVVRITNEAKKQQKLTGIYYIIYWIHLVRLIFYREVLKLDIDINEDRYRSGIISVCVGNAHGYGQTRSAVPYNGMLDVSLLFNPSLLQFPNLLFQLFIGRFLNNKKVKAYRTRRVKAQILKTTRASIDGFLEKVPAGSYVDVSVKHDEVSFVIP